MRRPTADGALQVVVDEATLVLPLAGVIDLEQERQRLDKALAKADGEIGRFEQKLANPKFLDRAPPAVIEEQRARLDEALQARAKLQAARARSHPEPTAARTRRILEPVASTSRGGHAALFRDRGDRGPAHLGRAGQRL